MSLLLFALLLPVVLGGHNVLWLQPNWKQEIAKSHINTYSPVVLKFWISQRQVKESFKKNQMSLQAERPNH